MVTKIKGTGLLLALAFGLPACGDDDGERGRPSCAQLCARIEAPDCPNAAPDCLEACEEDITSTPKACDVELDALASCFGRATFTCDVQGVPTADDCKDQLDRWSRCVASAPNDPPDGNGDGDDLGDGDGMGGGEGDDDGSPNQCDADQSDTTCDACLKTSCCSELSACGADCQAILSCAEFCTDDACIETCIGENHAGAQQIAALSTCLATSCATSCSDETSDPSSELCLPSEVPDGYCDGTGALTIGHDCPGGQPFENCVLSPTGAANVYCCDQ